MRITLVLAALFWQQFYGAPRPLLKNISTAGVTVVKSGAGTLHLFTVNNAGGNPCTATVYDSTTNSGTKLAVIDCTASKQMSYESDVANGITIDTTGDTSPADITVSYN